jgi:hypothetical protein
MAKGILTILVDELKEDSLSADDEYAMVARYLENTLPLIDTSSHEPLIVLPDVAEVLSMETDKMFDAFSKCMNGGA